MSELKINKIYFFFYIFNFPELKLSVFLQFCKPGFWGVPRIPGGVCRIVQKLIRKRGEKVPVFTDLSNY